MARTHPSLPRAFVEEHFAFHERVLAGTPQLPPRWKRAMEDTNLALGEAIGKLYVRRYFPAAEKARAAAMVQGLIGAFALRIDRLEWMAPATRAKAEEKLATLRVGVGYPDNWRGFSSPRLDRGDAPRTPDPALLLHHPPHLPQLAPP